MKTIINNANEKMKLQNIIAAEFGLDVDDGLIGGDSVESVQRGATVE